jgi:hypothetical protein
MEILNQWFDNSTLSILCKVSVFLIHLKQIKEFCLPYILTYAKWQWRIINTFKFWDTSLKLSRTKGHESDPKTARNMENHRVKEGPWTVSRRNRTQLDSGKREENYFSQKKIGIKIPPILSSLFQPSQTKWKLYPSKNRISAEYLRKQSCHPTCEQNKYKCIWENRVQRLI